MTPLFLRFNGSKVTLSGFAGGEYLPLLASKGPAFPFPSALLTLEGYPTSPPDSLRNNGVPLEKSGNSSRLFIDIQAQFHYCHPDGLSCSLIYNVTLRYSSMQHIRGIEYHMGFCGHANQRSPPLDSVEHDHIPLPGDDIHTNEKRRKVK